MHTYTILPHITQTYIIYMDIYIWIQDSLITSPKSMNLGSYSSTFLPSSWCQKYREHRVLPIPSIFSISGQHLTPWSFLPGILSLSFQSQFPSVLRLPCALVIDVFILEKWTMLITGLAPCTVEVWLNFCLGFLHLRMPRQLTLWQKRLNTQYAEPSTLFCNTLD